MQENVNFHSSTDVRLSLYMDSRVTRQNGDIKNLSKAVSVKTVIPGEFQTEKRSQNQLKVHSREASDGRIGNDTIGMVSHMAAGSDTISSWASYREIRWPRLNVRGDR